MDKEDTTDTMVTAVTASAVGASVALPIATLVGVNAGIASGGTAVAATAFTAGVAAMSAPIVLGAAVIVGGTGLALKGLGVPMPNIPATRIGRACARKIHKLRKNYNIVSPIQRR